MSEGKIEVGGSGRGPGVLGKIKFVVCGWVSFRWLHGFNVYPSNKWSERLTLERPDDTYSSAKKESLRKRALTSAETLCNVRYVWGFITGSSKNRAYDSSCRE